MNESNNKRGYDVWFTADTHFGHSNIIKYCNRPFATVGEMNETLIKNWNSVVKPRDMVYHLGDFCFGKDDYTFDLYFKQLNGLIIFIKGNHDKLAWRNKHKFFASSDFGREIEVDGQKITLCHYAMRVWDKSHYTAWDLYGHSHGSLPDDPHALSIDVGVDCHNYTPISFEQVGEIMAKKNWKPIDHHGDRKEEGGVGLNKADYEKLERRRQYEMLKLEFEVEVSEERKREYDIIDKISPYNKDGSVKFKDIPKYGDLFTLEDFIKSDLCFNDGSGYLATKDKTTAIPFYPNAEIPKWCTHVIWFNK